MTKRALHLVGMMWAATVLGSLGVQAADAPEVSFRKAADLAVRESFDDDAFIDAVQGALPLYPIVAVSTQEERVAQTTLVLNRRGLHFDAFRFRVPADQPYMLLWSFAFPEGPERRWNIVPASGRMSGFPGHFSLPGFQYDPCPWPPENPVTLQLLGNQMLDAGREYIIWFAMETYEPVELPVRLLCLADVKNRQTGFFGRPLPLVETNGFSVCLRGEDRLWNAVGLATSLMWQREAVRDSFQYSNGRSKLEQFLASGAIQLDRVDTAWLAASAARPEALAYFLRLGVDPNMTSMDEAHTSPVREAARYRSLLVKSAPELDAEDEQVATCVTSLLQAGADPNECGPRGGWSALMVAAHMPTSTRPTRPAGRRWTAIAA